MMVSSPATVPTIVGQPGPVQGRGDHVGRAGRGAHDDQVGRRGPPRRPSRRAPGAGAPRARPGPSGARARRTPIRPRPPRTFTAPISSRSRETVAWVASTPVGRQQLDQLALAGRRRLLEDLDRCGAGAGSWTASRRRPLRRRATAGGRGRRASGSRPGPRPALAGPSITAALTSRPRWAGRQWRNTAPGAAPAIRASSTW